MSSTIVHQKSKSKTVNHHICTDDDGTTLAIDFDCIDGTMPRSIYLSLRTKDRRFKREWQRFDLETIRSMYEVFQTIFDIEAQCRLDNK